MSTEENLLKYAPNVDPSKVSEHTRQVLTDLLLRSNNARARITSVTRTPHDQARIMHDNLLKHGVDYERKLYLAPGNQVIDVFEADAHKDAASTIADMEAKIIELGPETVSHHCADPSKLNVTDIALSSLARHDSFVLAAREDPRVSKCLDEPNNSCVHVEIPQPQPAA